MKLYWKMPAPLRQHYRQELQQKQIQKIMNGLKMLLLFVGNLSMSISCISNKGLTAKVERIQTTYKNRVVTARKLTVVSQIPISIDSAWKKVQTSALLNFVAAGKVKFKPTEGHFPQIWQEGDTVSTKMLIYGFLPFGGIHSLSFEKIDSVNKVLQTKEWDKSAKIWNHKISLKKLSEKNIMYEDEIIIYGGVMTGFITYWAKSFYKHRQKRWQLVSESI